MHELPSGTVTFLFTDVEGSTLLLAELGTDAYGRALEDHRAALREALTGIDALAASDGLVVFEHARRAPVPESVGPLALTRDLVSGDSALAFYAWQR